MRNHEGFEPSDGKGQSVTYHAISKLPGTETILEENRLLKGPHQSGEPLRKKLQGYERLCAVDYQVVSEG
jgi:hypothetical protein